MLEISVDVRVALSAVGIVAVVTEYAGKRVAWRPSDGFWLDSRARAIRLYSRRLLDARTQTTAHDELLKVLCNEALVLEVKVRPRDELFDKVEVA